MGDAQQDPVVLVCYTMSLILVYYNLTDKLKMLMRQIAALEERCLDLEAKCNPPSVSGQSSTTPVTPSAVQLQPASAPVRNPFPRF